MGSGRHLGSRVVLFSATTKTCTIPHYLKYYVLQALSNPMCPKSKDQEGWDTISSLWQMDQKSGRELKSNRKLSQRHVEHDVNGDRLEEIKNKMTTGAPLAAQAKIFDLNSQTPSSL